MLKNFLIVVALSLLSCACNSRPETPRYFSQVTGVSLCAGAQVRNLNADAPDRSPGFDSIYIVEVSLPTACRDGFFKEVSKRLHMRCDPSRSCSGVTGDGDFLRVEPLRRGFRITHST
jgi:hypothetical protein